MNQHLLLIGYRGTGKTTVATLLAQALNRPVVDTDRLITEREGKPIAGIFRDHGESYFRDRETEALQTALQSPPQVISTGGGIVLREANRDLLRQGQVIWLRASLDTIWRRLQADPEYRPALTDLPPREEIAHLLAVREPLYASCAYFTVDTDTLSPQDSVNLILQHLPRA